MSTKRSFGIVKLRHLLAPVLLGVLSTGFAQVTCEEELPFTFWGSPQEKRAVDDMIASFNESHPGITVRGQHIPTDYGIKLNTMIAGGTPPAAGYQLINREIVESVTVQLVLDGLRRGSASGHREYGAMIRRSRQRGS